MSWEPKNETVVAIGKSTRTYGEGGAVFTAERGAGNRIVRYWVRWGRRPDGVFAGGGQVYRGRGARARAAECFKQITSGPVGQ